MPVPRTPGRRGSEIPIVSYARISADVARDAHGVDNQHNENRETAARYGCEIVMEITDNDRSASKIEVFREGFDLLIKTLALGATPDGKPIKGAIAVTQDRVARRFSDWERFTDALTVEPGRIYIQAGRIQDPYSDGFMWEGAAGMVGAKSEPKKIAERLRRSHRHRAYSGIPVGGSQPWGWQPDKLTLDPVYAPMAARFVRDFIRGRTLGSIVRELQGKGIKTTSGNAWTMDAMRKYLRNPRLCGWRVIDGEIVRDSDGDPIVGQWKPIVSAEEWLAVRAIFDDRKMARFSSAGISGKLDPGFDGRKYLLTGFLRCGRPTDDGSICLRKLVGRPYESKRMGKVHLYTCLGKEQGGCAGVGRNGPRIEAFVIEAVLSRLEQESLTPAEPVDWPREAEYEQVLSARADLIKAWNKGLGSIPTDTFTQILLPGVEEDLKVLKNDRDAHLARLARSAAMRVDVRAEWDEHGELGFRRQIIGRALNMAVVHPVPKGTKHWVDGSVSLMFRD